MLMEVRYIRSWCPFRVTEIPEILPPTLGLFWDSGSPKKQPLSKGAGVPEHPAPGLAAAGRKLLPALARRLRPPPDAPLPPAQRCPLSAPRAAGGRRTPTQAQGAEGAAAREASRGDSTRGPGGGGAGGAWAPRGREGGLRRPGARRSHGGSCVPPLPGRGGWPAVGVVAANWARDSEPGGGPARTWS